MNVAQANAIDQTVDEIMDEVTRARTQERSINEAGIRRAVIRTIEDYVSADPMPVHAGPKVRSGDPATSRRAALDNLPRRNNQYRRIITLLADRPSWTPTAEEIGAQSGIRLNSVSTRLSELERAAWVNVIDRSGKRQTYQISTRGLLRYRIATQQESRGTA
jgi:hypothetical protein